NYNSIGLRTIVPFGLILNELLSNSFKYAFNNQRGSINIEINALDKSEFELKYSDSGIWKKASENKLHFGLELIETLTEQLEGSCIRKNSNYSFKFKNLDI
ncbi:MAG: histidine kinase, partial [Flavobacteriales bacterium CG_4_9_14_3_um_filter_32_8]